ncbi:thioredoxin family protein [Evansella sp. AB-rgal1]|uniref:thioredoxin family protein n=1 Tax=Evansella sp. AB-rgal1 TaxID=3242696 RepID=UPI00359E0F04
MKKVILFGIIIVTIFAALGAVTAYQNKQQAEGNPFGKRTNPATDKQLDDPNYQNIILPEALDTKIASGEGVTVYFYSPLCEYCNLATPVLVPKANELNVDVYLYNVLEFEQGWNDYELTGTPTLVHFENGVEADRLIGFHEEDAFEQFLLNTIN